MPEEKRMVQNYEVKNTIHIGGKEILLAEDPSSKEPYMVCEARWDNPFGVDIYEKAVVGADYLEAMTVFLGRVSGAVQHIREQRAERGVTGEPLTAPDCIPDSASSHYEGQLVVIRPEKMVASARTADMQLLLATAGNGCNPDARGQAVFCKNLFTGKTIRWERTDVAGIILPERVPAWARQKLAEMGIDQAAVNDIQGTPAVYMGSLEEAMESNAVAAFHKSHEMNTACAKGIDLAIRDCYKGDYRYDLPAALKAVTAEYGAERVHMVLANTLDRMAHDGRFSQANKDWGKGLALPRQTTQQRSNYVCGTHSAILDGFINHARKAQPEKEKRPSVMDSLKAQAAQAKQKPPAAKKKDKSRGEGR